MSLPSSSVSDISSPSFLSHKFDRPIAEVSIYLSIYAGPCKTFCPGQTGNFHYLNFPLLGPLLGVINSTVYWLWFVHEIAELKKKYSFYICFSFVLNFMFFMKIFFIKE